MAGRRRLSRRNLLRRGGPARRGGRSRRGGTSTSGGIGTARGVGSARCCCTRSARCPLALVPTGLPRRRGDPARRPGGHLSCRRTRMACEILGRSSNGRSQFGHPRFEPRESMFDPRCPALLSVPGEALAAEPALENVVDDAEEIPRNAAGGDTGSDTDHGIAGRQRDPGGHRAEYGRRADLLAGRDDRPGHAGERRAPGCRPLGPSVQTDVVILAVFGRRSLPGRPPEAHRSVPVAGSGTGCSCQSR
jgi:hypothetical protein